MYFTPQQPSSKSTTTPPLNTPHSHSTNHTTAQQLATRYATPPLINTQQTPATTQQPLPPNTHRHQTPAGRAERAAHKSHLGRRARGRRGRRVCDELPHWLPGGLGACLHHMPVSLFFCLALNTESFSAPPPTHTSSSSRQRSPASMCSGACNPSSTIRQKQPQKSWRASHNATAPRQHGRARALRGRVRRAERRGSAQP